MSKIDRAEKRRGLRDERKKHTKSFTFNQMVGAVQQREEHIINVYKGLIDTLAQMGLAARCKDNKWTVTKIEEGEVNDGEK